MDALPIRQILTYVEKKRNMYPLYPKLLGLVVSYRPQLFGVTNQLVEEEEEKRQDINLFM